MLLLRAERLADGRGDFEDHTRRMQRIGLLGRTNERLLIGSRPANALPAQQLRRMELAHVSGHGACEIFRDIRIAGAAIMRRLRIGA
jgi:hypothetical protein